jgi:hypothetical protein
MSSDEAIDLIANKECFGLMPDVVELFDAPQLERVAMTGLSATDR